MLPGGTASGTHASELSLNSPQPRCLQTGGRELSPLVVTSLGIAASAGGATQLQLLKSGRANVFATTQDVFIFVTISWACWNLFLT